MRIEFPNVAREDFHWTQAQLTIGSAPENDLVLAGSQAAARHLHIRQDRRGRIDAASFCRCFLQRHVCM